MIKIWINGQIKKIPDAYSSINPNNNKCPKIDNNLQIQSINRLSTISQKGNNYSSNQPTYCSKLIYICMNKSLLASILLLLLPCFLANNISKSPAIQPATSPPSSPPLKTTPAVPLPGLPVPSSEPDNKLSSPLSPAAHSFPLPPTPSPTPPHSPAPPTSPMASRDTGVLFPPLRKRLPRPGVLLNPADRPNRNHLLS